MRTLTLLTWLLALAYWTQAQDKLSYQKPPREIMELVDAPIAPSVRINSKADVLLLLYRDAFKSITELSQKEMRLAGLRINPANNSSSRGKYYNNIEIKNARDPKPKAVQGLPQEPRIGNISWSPDESLVAFTHTTETNVELWILDIASLQAKKIVDGAINNNLGRSFLWFRDGKSLIVKKLPQDRKQLYAKDEIIPTGPTISSSDGEKAQNRTYQDLLQDKYDEENFEVLTEAELVKVDLDGKQSPFLPKALYRSFSFSPDGEYLMVTTLHRPFSYLVTYSRFPNTTTLYTKEAKLVKVFNEKPLIEVMPQGFMATYEGKRSIAWRADKAATLYWAEALDKGDPALKLDYRDAVYQQEAPFSASPQLLLKTINRFAGIEWANDSYAIASDYWINTRNRKTYLFNPSNNQQKPEILWDRNYQDVYSDPGNFVRKENQFGYSVLDVEGTKAYLIGEGYSSEGKKPFVDAYDLKTKKATRLLQLQNKEKLEHIVTAVDVKKGEFLTRVEGKTDFPNYYIRNIKKRIAPYPITFFENPFKSISKVHKEVITYQRKDGLELSATLYLPIGYDTTRKEKMPMIMWAYPREYKDKNSASQNTASDNSFTYPYYGNPIYWVTRGYVVLDDTSFPIIGEGDTEPNDSFREQLVANAKAAIDAVDARGFIDPDKVAVGGHSYGAFMTANLLTHSNLFACGIARSGAYNRTLTPFGFQAEERNYWEAPEVYYDMSPFSHADKMKTPLLLIHGADDNNSGTYPMQSERYFNAIKGLGGTARLVMLPKESHGYVAKESILHMLWEQNQWLDKYLKNK